MADTKTPLPDDQKLAPQYQWYILSLATWFSAFGLQSVLFPYIVLYEMKASPFEAGIAQACLMLPNLFLIPFGGLIADHVELRGYLIKLHILALLPPLIMAGLHVQEVLTYPMTLAFALTMGTLTAFCIPARDAGLHSVAGGNMQKGVAGAMGTQFGSQIIGVSIASFISNFGVAALLIVQGIMVGSGAGPLSRIKPVPPHPKEQAGRVLHDLADGFREVYRSKPMLPFCIIGLGVGIFYIGVFMVGIPVFIRDVYHGDDNALSLAMGAFFVGTIVSSMTIMRRGGIRRVGRAYVFAIVSGVIIEFVLSRHIPFSAFVGMIFLWGCGAGVAMTMGRSFVQETAKPSHRARILAVYSMGFMGGGPIGSFLTGTMIDLVGLHQAVLFAGIAMAVLVVVTVLLSSVWSATRPETREAV